MKLKKSLFLAGGLSALVLTVLMSGVLMLNAASRSTVVVFNANWCASCREVVPMVREVAGQNNLPVEVIDVDAQNAPAQARGYGLSIPSSDPPQVYLVTNGRVTLLYDGKNYAYGRGEAIRSSLLQNLRQGLGAGASGK